MWSRFVNVNSGQLVLICSPAQSYRDLHLCVFRWKLPRDCTVLVLRTRRLPKNGLRRSRIPYSDQHLPGGWSSHILSLRGRKDHWCQLRHVCSRVYHTLIWTVLVLWNGISEGPIVILTISDVDVSSGRFLVLICKQWHAMAECVFGGWAYWASDGWPLRERYILVTCPKGLRPRRSQSLVFRD